MYFQLMNFNTQVCNASIQALRNEVYDMFKVREDDTNSENNERSHEKFSDFDEDSSIDIFEEFDKALAEYEEDLMTKETENLNIVIPESEFSLKISCFDAKNIQGESKKCVISKSMHIALRAIKIKQIIF